jgi:hypothetical protein
MGPSRLRRRLAAAAVIALMAVVGPAVAAWGRFSAADEAAHTLSSDTLQPASNLSVTTGCSLLVLGPKADLTWTATPSTFASGYTVERWRGSTLEATTTVTPRTTTSLTESGLRTGTTYTWRVHAYYRSWTSPVISATKSTPGLCL